jgi:D-galactose 1-dehydrogenase
MTIRLGLVGLGKIAATQHVPAIAATPGIALHAVASRNASLPGLPDYRDIQSLIAGEPGVTAITLCTPPQGRFDQAAAALSAGKHLMIEKPPGATVAEVATLAALAERQGVTLFATWHSREAAGVEAARTALAATTVRGVRISWKEDVRHWHPGQQWIWEPGGFGVFDPGINALSILTRILPDAVHLTAADLFFPANRAAPIAARLAMRTAGGAPVEAEFDWRQTGPQTWDIEVQTDAGPLLLSHGGSRLVVGGVEQVAEPDREYARLYRRFVDLVGTRRSDVDLAPIVLVADAFLIGKRHDVEPFEEA